MEAFFTIHSDLPREGPGDRESLDWAMSVARPPTDARILDAGCGPGADIEGLLAHAPRGHVLAVDLHQPFVDHVAEVWKGDARVTAMVADMVRVAGTFDLIWSAGAVYFLGVRAALEGWRGALAPGGRVVFSELAWRSDNPPKAARDYFAEEYPQMQRADAVQSAVSAAGYRTLAARFLGPDAWNAYYAPIEARIAVLTASGAAADPELARAIAQHQAEIATWRNHGESHGYLLCVTEPA